MKIICFISSVIGGFVITLIIRTFILTGVPTTDSTAIPVALETSNGLPAASLKGVKPHQIELNWGGFYAYQTETGYRVFRLIDLDAKQYHIMNFDDEFETIPSISQVRFLIPDVEHATGNSLDFLGVQPMFLGAKQLIRDELLATQNYHISNGIPPSEAQLLINRILKQTQEESFESLLVVKNGKLTFDLPSI